MCVWVCAMSFRKADINGMDETKKTTLDYAVLLNDLKNIELLLDHGAGESMHLHV